MGALRSLLVPLDPTPAAAVRLDTARALAATHGATVAAMYVAAPAQPPLQLALAEGPAALVAQGEGAPRERTRHRFDTLVHAGGPPMHWLEPAFGDPVEAFAREAMYADLLVLSQHDAQVPAGHAAPPDLVEATLLGTGRPALVLPAQHGGGPCGRQVLLGWNATPSAARALAAAWPWLAEARQVHVLEALEDDEPRPAGGLDIVRYLALHGVPARTHRLRTSARESGDVLLAIAADVGADLLVMGCYGRSRARERVLGGASRTVLRRMALPVLMAH